jgi:Mn2+/Fe2+ NRAMP family transporter
MTVKGRLSKLGPGLLFAASAVGTSHLVMSTRAGADYGLYMSLLIIAACLIKYPAFRFGGMYAAATRSTLIDNYRQQGWWALAIFTAELVVNMFIATAAIALATSGIINHVFAVQMDDVTMASLIIATCGAILLAGKYHLLESITRFFVATFTVLIFLAVCFSANQLDTTTVTDPVFNLDKQNTLFFIIAMAGWMPTAMGGSTFQSLWVCAKYKDTGVMLTPAETGFDFRLSYVCTTILALCFLFLGAVLMNQQGIATAASATAFAGQLMDLFQAAIGNWAYPLIAAAAMAIMLSTVLAITDACPRGVDAMLNPEELSLKKKNSAVYNLFIVIQCGGAIAVLMLFMNSFKAFLDFAMTVAFLIAPLLAALNHRAIFSSQVPAELQPGVAMRLWSLSGIAIMLAIGCGYLYLRFFS